MVACVRGGAGIVPSNPTALGSLTATEYSNARCWISASEFYSRRYRIDWDDSLAAGHLVYILATVDTAYLMRIYICKGPSTICMIVFIMPAGSVMSWAHSPMQYKHAVIRVSL